MKLIFNDFYDKFILEFEDEDKCHYCKYSDKCPLIQAFIDGEYVISSRRDGSVPVSDFCTLYEPSDRIQNLEKMLKRKGKGKDV